MAVKKRGKKWHIKIRVFGKEVGVATQVTLKVEAEDIERDILRACRSGDYRSLDSDSREACIRMFRNQGWELPSGLVLEQEAREELTLWKAIELCLKHPDTKNTKNRQRIEQCFVHLVDYWGKDLPIKSIWIPEIKEYQLERLSQKAAPATVNKEKAALSKIFQTLLELKHVDVNPARMVKSLSEKSGEREVYISAIDFQEILDRLPLWFRPIALTAYYTGMRRGEVVGLTRSRLSLDKRMIHLGPDDVKERQWKRVPIHRDLVPILEEVLRVLPLGHDYVFHHNGKPVTRKDQLRWCWDRKVLGLGMEPPPRFHDLRHTWRTNARRSGVDPQIAETIMGHVFRLRSVNDRYGRISDQELLKAIDMMSFDNGETEILVVQK